MPKIVYVGPLGAVDVPRWQIGNAEYGVPVEVSDEAAADLLLQTEVWQTAKAAAKAAKSDDSQEG